MINLGTVRPGSTIYVPFQTFDSNDPSASVTITGLAVTDIEVYKDGSVTQRASDAGYTLLDTDGIDFDTTTGIHGFSIDLSDNTTAGFWAAGSRYFVVIASITVDAATINFVPVMFEIGYEGAILNTTMATRASATSFTLANGSTDDDAYNNCPIIIHNIASAYDMVVGYVLDYTGSTKTITLAADPGVITSAATDHLSILPPVNVAAIGTTLQTANDVGADANTLVTRVPQTLNLTASGNIGIDWANVENPTTALDLSGTDIQLVDTTTTNTDMRGTDNAALASVLGALTDVAAAGDPTTADTVMQYVKQLINVLIGTAGIGTWPTAAAPANAVSIAEALRAVYDDTNEIQVDTNSLNDTKIPDTISLANINAEADTALTDFFTSAATLVNLIWDEAMVETTGAPAITGTMREFMQWWAALSRDKMTQTATTSTLRNDADAADLSTSTVSDDGTTFTRGEWSV